MSGARWIVARRELVERARSRAFQVATALQVLAIAAGLVIATVAGGGGGEEVRTVALAGSGSAQYRQALESGGAMPDVELHGRRVQDRAAAVRALRAGDVDAALIEGRELIVEDDPDGQLAAALRSVHRRIALSDALQRAGVAPDRLRAALSPPPLRVRALEPAQDDEDARRGIAFLGILLLYLAIFTYGLWVAGGVIEEKASRVIEVVLSAIPPRELLAGKIIGLGILGLAQFLLVVVVGLVGASVLDPIDLPDVTVGWAAIIALWFALGYGLYACLYATAGALVSRQEDLQSSTAALNMVVIGVYLLSFIAIENAGGGLMAVLSFLPLSAPMAMPARWLLDDVPAWQLLLSIALSLLSILALLRVARTVYARSALRLGPRLSLRRTLSKRDA